MLKTALALLLALSSASAFTPALRLPSMSRAHGGNSLALRMKCPLVPLGSNIIIQMEKESSAEQMTSSGIMIAATVKTEGPKTGKVAAVGSGWYTDSGNKIPVDEVKVGDKVMFREPNALEARKMKTPEGEWFVLSVNDILAKIVD